MSLARLPGSFVLVLVFACPARAQQTPGTAPPPLVLPPRVGVMSASPVRSRSVTPSG